MVYALDFFTNNFMQIFCIIALFILVLTNQSFEVRTRNIIFSLGIVILLLMYFEFIDATLTVYEDYDSSLISLRKLASCFCYAARPLAFYLSIIILYDIKKETSYVLFIPCFANAAISTLTYWFGLISYIDKQNIWHPGPLHAFYFIICGFYFVVFIVFLIYNWKRMEFSEKISTSFFVISISTSSIVDVVADDSHTLVLSIISSFLMYYLFLYTSWSKKLIDFQNEKLAKQERNLLSSQIQPHFIYNTLNIIYSLCHSNPNLAGDTVLTFSNYLRNNLDLSNTTDLIPIEKEIEHTKLYSNIEQLRFTELKVIYDIQDGEYDVPFLIIQPMVENAIRHGVRGTENGTVKVSLYTEEFPFLPKYHVIKIEDNGTGKSIANPSLGTHKSIGIKNVKERVEEQLNGIFNIDMKPTGTTVTIKIPY